MYHFDTPTSPGKKTPNKQKASVTYNMYTKCKEALQNIMLLR